MQLFYQLLLENVNMIKDNSSQIDFYLGYYQIDLSSHQYDDSMTGIGMFICAGPSYFALDNRYPYMNAPHKPSTNLRINR